MEKKTKILIATGIFPPQIGGPAQYAKNLSDTLIKRDFLVSIKTYGIERRLPTGIRHFFFFCKIIPAVLTTDAVIILDTFSVGFPTTLACKIFGKKSIIRTGGDFLWEGYVERTGKKVLLRDFYSTETRLFNLKERIIFGLTQFVLRNASKIVFSTNWQRNIFFSPYRLDLKRTTVIENYYGQKESSQNPQFARFIGSTRVLVWKNLDTMEEVFGIVTRDNPSVSLFMENLPYEEFMDKMKSAYAVILVSLGDISPNMILDAIRLNIPFICTKEVGIFDRIKDAGAFVDPLNKKEIESAVRMLLTTSGYENSKKRVSGFSFVHTWEDIAFEFLAVINNLK